jgi:hypothetical protein
MRIETCFAAIHEIRVKLIHGSLAWWVDFTVINPAESSQGNDCQRNKGEAAA